MWVLSESCGDPSGSPGSATYRTFGFSLDAMTGSQSGREDTRWRKRTERERRQTCERKVCQVQCRRKERLELGEVAKERKRVTNGTLPIPLVRGPIWKIRIPLLVLGEVYTAKRQ